MDPDATGGGTMRFRAAMYVEYPDIPTYIEMGWFAPEPEYIDHYHAYGIVMLWLCACKPPVPLEARQ
jgi:hypothetical protein